jgi:hypothetical protein
MTRQLSRAATIDSLQSLPGVMLRGAIQQRSPFASSAAQVVSAATLSLLEWLINASKVIVRIALGIADEGKIVSPPRHPAWRRQIAQQG